jgi:hypothetical protein
VHQVCREQQRVFMNGAWSDFSRATGFEQVSLKRGKLDGSSSGWQMISARGRRQLNVMP